MNHFWFLLIAITPDCSIFFFFFFSSLVCFRIRLLLLLFLQIFCKRLESNVFVSPSNWQTKWEFLSLCLCCIAICRSLFYIASHFPPHLAHEFVQLCGMPAMNKSTEKLEMHLNEKNHEINGYCWLYDSIDWINWNALI